MSATTILLRAMNARARRLVLATAAGACALAAVGCSGHGEYTGEHLNAAEQRLAEIKSGTEWQMAQQQFFAGDLDKALKSVDTSIALNDKVAKSHLLRGRILMEMGRLEDARSAFLKTLEIDEEFTEAYYFVGIIYERFARFELALESYMKAVEQEPTNAQYVVAAAEMMMTQGHVDQAVALLESQKDTLEYNAAVRQTLGHAAMLDGRHTDAIEYFEEASLLSPDDMLIIEDLIGAQVEAGRFAEAEFNLNRLLDQTEFADRRDLLRMRAKCLIEMDRLLEARSVLLGLTNTPGGEKDVETWIELGTVSYAIDERQRLRTTASRVIAMAPQRPEGYLLRSMYMFREGQLDAALAMADRACELSPTNGTPFVFRAMIQHDRGRPNAAIDNLQTALSIDPTNESARALLDRLESTATFAGVETAP